MKIDVLGVKIDALTKTDILKRITGHLDQNQPIFIVTPYSESIVEAQNDQEYKKILNNADIALADGIGIVWAAHFQESEVRSQNLVFRVLELLFKLLTSLGAIIISPKKISDAIPEKISGSEFIWDLAGLAESRGESVFLLGGFEDTPGLVAAKLKNEFPNLKIAGTYTGSPEEQGIVERVNQSSADFLFVAFGPKRQEKWIYENLPRSQPTKAVVRGLPKLAVKLAIGLGGTFDYIAKKRAPAPQILRFRGLEWLWRLTTQPWRTFRIFQGVLGLTYYTFRQKVRYN